MLIISASHTEWSINSSETPSAKLNPIEGEWKRFQADDPLLAFLASL